MSRVHAARRYPRTKSDRERGGAHLDGDLPARRGAEEPPLGVAVEPLAVRPSKLAGSASRPPSPRYRASPAGIRTTRISFSTADSSTCTVVANLPKPQPKKKKKRLMKASLSVHDRSVSRLM